MKKISSGNFTVPVKRSKKAGLPPGSLVFIGDKKEGDLKITLFNYHREAFEEKSFTQIEDCLPYRDEKSVTWINIDGLHDIEKIEKIGTVFNLHPLTLEDIVNTGQRPKAEDYDDYMFVVIRMLNYDEQTKKIGSEQVSIVLAKNFVLSFQEKEGDLFDPIRIRIRDSKSKIRMESGNDYLMYRMIDLVVDHYFVLMEKIGDNIEELEESIMRLKGENILEEIQSIKKDLLLMRRSVYPLREVISFLDKNDSKLLNKRTQRHIRDVYDHTVQIIETLEIFREMVTGLKDAYHSTLNIQMNLVMKTLTIIATIFIPLTFIAGVYGMNFTNMPELEWHYGYYVIMAVMGAIFFGMLFYFRKLKWF